jgi:hypothetical protein
MEEHLRNFIKKTPLEILATFLLELHIKRSTARKLFSAYNAFLAILNNPKKREHLKNLHYNQIPGDKIFNEVRRCGQQFQEGLTSLFFEDNKNLRDLTIFYGVF